MSDPAQKALGPAPVTMTQRIVSLSLHIVTASTIAFAMAGVAALNLSGRLSVIVATGPSTVNRIVSVMMCGSGHRRFAGGRAAPHAACRSEEHTSELQSLMRISYAVFCLKKKKQKNNK